jgi:DNA-directed RNA polymerase specialized sigma subunit
MTACIDSEVSVRAVRESLREQLAILDRLQLRRAAVEVSSAIELLNDELGEKTSDDEIAQLLRTTFSD